MSSSVHPVDEKLPLWQLLFFGFQHVLAMYSGAVAVPLVLAQAINLDTERLIYLINAGLFTCGYAYDYHCQLLGTIIACFMGYVDFTPVAKAASLGITTPFAFGLPTFDPAACVAMTLVMLVTMAETTGDMMAIAISVGVAMIPVCSPGFYSKFPVTMQLICNSSITIGSITAMLLNFLLNKPQKEETFLDEN